MCFIGGTPHSDGIAAGRRRTAAGGYGASGKRADHGNGRSETVQQWHLLSVDMTALWLYQSRRRRREGGEEGAGERAGTLKTAIDRRGKMRQSEAGEEVWPMQWEAGMRKQCAGGRREEPLPGAQALSRSGQRCRGGSGLPPSSAALCPPLAEALPLQRPGSRCSASSGAAPPLRPEALAADAETRPGPDCLCLREQRWWGG